jgi:hypothetical protein
MSGSSSLVREIDEGGLPICTEYSNETWLASKNVSVIDPIVDRPTLCESKGTVSNEGPVV